jgi:hypothetical protein
MDRKTSLQELGSRLLTEPEAGAVTDYAAARRLEISAPNTSNAWTHVTPALAKYAKRVGKRSLFGNDKEEKAYRTLVEKLRLVVLGLYGDELLSPGSEAEECLMTLLGSLVTFKAIYPNWTDAYSAAYRVFVERSEDILPILEKLQLSVEMQLLRKQD